MCSMSTTHNTETHVSRQVARYPGEHRSTVVEAVAYSVYGGDTRRADAAVTAAENAGVVTVDGVGRVHPR